MHVLMLGWEFPPFITGGLGTACHGLTRGLDRRGVHVTFVLPQPVSGDAADHVTVLSPAGTSGGAATTGRPMPAAETGAADADAPGAEDVFEHVDFLGIPTTLRHTYQKSADEGPVGRSSSRLGPALGPGSLGGAETDDAGADVPGGAGAAAGYGGDLMRVVAEYAAFCRTATRGLSFDVIHAHDWMTFPAGLAIARATGRPLVVHVHSTEFDRSGEGVNQAVYDVERRGMHGAMRVVAVSQLTKNQIVARYAVPADRVEVVYNGVEMGAAQVPVTGIRRKDRIVLYFGRITFQKGPEYFVRAAKRVLEVMDDVKFVVAGSGDMAARMIEMAAELGIGHKVLFTGFLRGGDIQRVFAIADLYVMPSVSEPFGIAPLEAISHDVPVLISRSSGVSEVLSHALKVDFWDVDDMANKIVAVLRHPPLSQTLRAHGAFEARQLTWDGAAERCERIYGDVVREMIGRRAPSMPRA